MQILHTIPSIDPSYGGPVAVVEGLCLSLQKRGIHPEILTSSSGDLSMDKKNGRRFQDIPLHWSHPWLGRFYWDPFLGMKIKSMLSGVDLVHIHGMFNGISQCVARGARRWGIPYIIEPFGTLSPYCLAKSRWKKKMSLSMVERENITNASALQFTSQAEWDRASLNFEIPHGFIAGNGLDWREFGQLPEKGMFRKKWNIDSKRMVFLFVGRLQPIKGLELFLPAYLKWIKTVRERPLLILIGPNENHYQSLLEKLIEQDQDKETILFLGAMYGAERLEAFVDANVVVLPSFHENFGISAVEAMACGKPVLVSSGVDLAAVVRKYKMGEVTAPERSDMVLALQRLYERCLDWEGMGCRGRRWVREHCDWEKITEIVFQKYQEILNHG